MRMEAGLDTGPVAAVASLEIRDDDTAGSLARRLGLLGADLLLETLPSIASGTEAVTPQNDSSATLAPLLKKEDGRLDFSQPTPLVSARARGVDPWPGATVLLDGQVVKLFGPRTAPAPSHVDVSPGGAASPGTVLRIDGEGLHVACADGEIVFQEVQLPGRKRMPAQAAAAGRGVAVGARLG